jgi:hypothetical protein
LTVKRRTQHFWASDRRTWDANWSESRGLS